MDATHTQRLFLLVDRPDGGRWTPPLPHDAARFIGPHALVPGIGDADGMLRFTSLPDC